MEPTYGASSGGTAPSEPQPIPVCSNCGGAVDTTGAFCWQCGVPLSTGREPFIPEGRQASVAAGARSETLGVYGLTGRSVDRGRARKRDAGTSLGARRRVGGLLLLVGVVLLIGSLFLGWYAVSATATDSVNGTQLTENGHEVLYPLNDVSFTITCSGSRYCLNSTFSGPYSQSGVTSLGAMYTVVAGLLLGGLAAAATSAILTFTHKGRPSRWSEGLAVLAVALVVIAPTMVALGQPSLLTSQGSSPASGNATGGPSPRTSFFGSCSGSSCGEALSSGEAVAASWGPSLGWYLSFAGALVLFVGFLLIRSPDRRSVVGSSIYRTP